MTVDAFRIARVAGTDDVVATARLFEAYAASLDVDLSFQGFASEVATLPGAYAAPAGALLLARARDGTPLGCVAVRPQDRNGLCEMKRLYVDPAARGLGLGRALIAAAIDEAVAAGYRAMRLDTLPTMSTAIGLYLAAGFVPTPPYYDTPIAGTLFLTRGLR